MMVEGLLRFYSTVERVKHNEKSEKKRNGLLNKDKKQKRSRKETNEIIVEKREKGHKR